MGKERTGVGRADPLVRVKGVSRAFPGVQALSQVDLDLLPGEVHVLLGENGAGKSTLVKILSGVYAPDAGEIELQGEVVRLASPHTARMLGIATIYQEPTLAPTLTVAENLYLGREPRLAGVRGLVDRARLVRDAQAFLDELGFPLRASEQVRTLSVAEWQLVEIARALVANVRVLIMDEPTAALTEHEVERLFDIIRELRRRDVAILYISHRLSEVAAIGDQVTVFRDGQNVTTLPATTPVDALIRYMVGRDLQDIFPPLAAVRDDCLLRARRLGRRGDFHEVDLDIFAGEIVGVAGLIGCGRSELVRALAGVDRFDSGTLEVGGRRLSAGSPEQALGRGVTFLPADRKRDGLLIARSVRENVVLSALPRLSRWGVLRQAAESEDTDRFVRELRIQTTSINRPVQVLSGGNQQKTLLARSLCRGARVFVFDEPTRGIDVGTKVEIYHLLNALAREGAGVLVSSSDLSELLGLCHRVVVMAHGSVTAVLGQEELSEERVTAAAFVEPGEQRPAA